jgi:hypothetical protein
MNILIILVVCGICDSVPKILPRQNRKVISRHLPFSIRSKHSEIHHNQKQKAAYLTKDHKSSQEDDEVSDSKPVYFEVPYIELIYAPEHKDIHYRREIYGPELIPGIIMQNNVHAHFQPCFISVHVRETVRAYQTRQTDQP